LFLPISARMPGDHEAMMTCGNTFELELFQFTGSDGKYYYESAYRRCMDERMTRIAQAVGAVSVTFLATVVATRRPRRT
jgi:hypothetical protein